MKTYSVVLQPNQVGLHFYADKQQAKKVFDLLIKRLSQKGPPYDTAHVPQADHFLPQNMEKGTAQHAVFLFVLCFWMRGGVESDTAALLLKKAYEEKPEAFDPFRYSGSSSVESSVTYISEILTSYRLGQRIEENALGWVYNMRKIATHWSGDPRKIMDDKPSFLDLTKRIIGKTTGEGKVFVGEDSPYGFMFFREKMVAMIAYFLMDSGLVPRFYTPVPVDFHVLRLLTANQILRVEGKETEEVVGIDFARSSALQAAREITEWYCREFRISPIALCDALWLLSRTLCRDNPGNSGFVLDLKRQGKVKESPSLDEGAFPGMFETEVLESQGESIERGRKRYKGLKFTPDELLNRNNIKRFERSCGMCPVKETCRFNISSGFYYVGGRLVPERLRFVPPNKQVDFLSHPEFSSLKGKPPDQSIRYAEIYL